MPTVSKGGPNFMQSIVGRIECLGIRVVLPRNKGGAARSVSNSRPFGGWEFFGLSSFSQDGKAGKGLKKAVQKTHWTHKLFLQNAEVYLPFLEAAQSLASTETEALAGLFTRFSMPKDGKVLDVACGIGRHSILLAQRGYHVTGVDLSPLFIFEARQHAATAGVDVRWVLGDALEVQKLVKRDSPFDAFVNMFTSHGYYGRDADLSLFRQLRNLASPEAVLIVLTMNRDWLVRNFHPEGMERAGPFRVLQRRSLDLETSTIYNDWEFYEGEGEGLRLRLKVEMDHRLYSLHELRALLEEAG